MTYDELEQFNEMRIKIDKLEHDMMYQSSCVKDCISQYNEIQEKYNKEKEMVSNKQITIDVIDNAFVVTCEKDYKSRSTAHEVLSEAFEHICDQLLDKGVGEVFKVNIRSVGTGDEE